ncbi:hypothetical protein M153_3070005241 [Pseudoloma neurophilia]|uniref:Uncharacterized protein n=1 Tax=Pseudoloma neurophilia TaxID=146866 RepID=A0A0R0LYD6_9MICR|nr:hypothetical protein M153_3070005241 [Pseudoloma neurophilia]
MKERNNDIINFITECFSKLSLFSGVFFSFSIFYPCKRCLKSNNLLSLKIWCSEGLSDTFLQ